MNFWKWIAGWIVATPFAIVIWIVTIMPLLLARAYVLTWFWRWFIKPFGLPELTFWWSIGVIMTARMIFPGSPQKSTFKELFFENANRIVATFIALAIGWAFAHGMPANG